MRTSPHNPARKKHGRWLWLLPVIALLVGAGGFLSWGHTPTADPREVRRAELPPKEPVGDRTQRVEVIEASFTTIDSETTYPGVVKAAERAALAFRIGGPLVEVNAAPGDRVSKGDVLIRVDPRDYQRSVESAESSLDSAKARLLAMKRGAREEDIQVLRAQLDSAVARGEFLEQEFQRNERLLEGNAVSLAEHDASQSELTSIQADIRALKQELQKALKGSRKEDVDAAEADIRGMESRLLTARDRLADTSLLAPFDGIVTRRLVENHEQVAAGQTVLEMHNITTLEIDVDLPEKELLHRSLAKSFDATVRLVSLPSQEFTARFKEIDTDADSATRTYGVTFVMSAPTEVNVFPGMIADVTLSSAVDTEGAREAVTVPVLAVQNDRNGAKYVWLVDGVAATRRRVRLGAMLRGDRYEVLGGVSPGDLVIVAGASFLHEGVAVKARPSSHNKPTASPGPVPLAAGGPT